MEENNDIFLVTVMLLYTWRDQYATSILQQLSRAIHLLRTYLMTDFSALPPLCTHMYTFRVTPLCVRDFIDLILPSPILTLFVCHNFLILFYLKNLYFFVSDTHHFLGSHSVNSSLPRKIFSLMVASNCQLFYLS